MDAASGEPLEDKGSDSRSTLTSNGRVSIRRKRWQALEGGGVMPVDALLDAAEATVSLGARELCCRLNATGKSFIRTVAQLKHAAQVFLGETLLRELLATAGESGFHSLIARIVGENEGSIRLHEKCGFTLVGTEIEVGRKHGRWLDVVEYQYVVRARET